jgi:hypothetical protein
MLSLGQREHRFRSDADRDDRALEEPALDLELLAIEQSPDAVAVDGTLRELRRWMLGRNAGPAPGKVTRTGRLAEVQMKEAATRRRDDQAIRRAAAAGVAGAGLPLPYLQQIQRAFGPGHDLSSVRAQVGGAAADANAAMGSVAYAVGDTVAFASAPDLHTAAHEAAHVVQQRAGVSLPGGVGSQGDRYERHADAVADTVVAGGSAAALLDGLAATGAAVTAVQHKGGNRKKITESFTLPALPALEHENPENEAKLKLKLTVAGSGDLTKTLGEGDEGKDETITEQDREFVKTAAGNEFKGDVGQTLAKNGKWEMETVDIVGTMGVNASSPPDPKAEALTVSFKLKNGVLVTSEGKLVSNGMTGKPGKYEATAAETLTLLSDDTFELKGSFDVKQELEVEPDWQQVFITLREKYGQQFAGWAMQAAANQIAAQGPPTLTPLTAAPPIAELTTIDACVSAANNAATGYSAGVLAGLGGEGAGGDAAWFERGKTQGRGSLRDMVSYIAENSLFSGMGFSREQIEKLVVEAVKAKTVAVKAVIDEQGGKPIKILHVQKFRAYLAQEFSSYGHDPPSPVIASFLIPHLGRRGARIKEADTAAELLGVPVAATQGPPPDPSMLPSPAPAPGVSPPGPPPPGGGGDTPPDAPSTQDDKDKPKKKPTDKVGVKIADQRILAEVSKRKAWKPKDYKKVIFEKHIMVRGVRVTIKATMVGRGSGDVGFSLGPATLQGITLSVESLEEAKGKRVSGNATLVMPAELSANLGLSGSMEVTVGGLGVEGVGEGGLEASANVSARTRQSLAVEVGYKDGEVSLDEAHLAFHFGTGLDASLNAFIKAMVRFQEPPKGGGGGMGDGKPPDLLIPDFEKWLPKKKGTPSLGPGLLTPVFRRSWELAAYRWAFDYDHEADLVAPKGSGSGKIINGAEPGELPIKLDELYPDMMNIAQSNTQSDDGPGGKPMGEDKQLEIEHEKERASKAIDKLEQAILQEMVWIRDEIKECGSSAQFARYKQDCEAHLQKLEGYDQTDEMKQELADASADSDPGNALKRLRDLRDWADVDAATVRRMERNRPQGDWDMEYAGPEHGELRLLPPYRGKARRTFYPTAYSSATKERIAQQMVTKTENGKEFWEYTAADSPRGDKWWLVNDTRERPTLEHEPSVANHWNTTGHDSRWDVRRTFYNCDGHPFVLKPQTLNSSEGDHDEGGMTDLVTVNFRGKSL